MEHHYEQVYFYDTDSYFKCKFKYLSLLACTEIFSFNFFILFSEKWFQVFSERILKTGESKNIIVVHPCFPVSTQ